MATTYVQSRLGELLTAATAGLTLARTGNAIPSRLYVSHGPPAVDTCADDGLLCVYLDTPAVSLANPELRNAQQSGQFRMMPVLRMIIELWRCVPIPDGQGTPPTAAALTTSANALANDMWALLTYLETNRSSIFPTGLAATVIPNRGDPVPLPPKGGAAGWRVKIDTPINDGGP